MWEVVKRRVEFDALNLSTARREGLRYPLQALAVRGRQSALEDGLDGGHVGQSGRYTTREGAIPTRLVPLFPPIEEGGATLTGSISSEQWKNLSGVEASRRHWR